MDIRELIALANYLDEHGERVEADKIDSIVKKLVVAEEENHDLSVVGAPEPEVDMPFEEERDPQPPSAPEEVKQPGMSSVPELRTPDAAINAVNYIVDKYQGDKSHLMRILVVQLQRALEALQKEPMGGATATKREIFKKLSSMADGLDKIGAIESADMIDSFIQKHAEDVVDWKEEADTERSKRYDDRHHHKLQVREPKRDQERVDKEGRKTHHVHPYQKVEAHALSTRYCPEHQGVQMGRVGELTYQCPLDGGTYNWDTGWTDYDGNQHPGGSVAGQTPDSSGYAIPHRIFDSREEILNRVN